MLVDLRNNLLYGTVVDEGFKAVPNLFNVCGVWYFDLSSFNFFRIQIFLIIEVSIAYLAYPFLLWIFFCRSFNFFLSFYFVLSQQLLDQCICALVYLIFLNIFHGLFWVINFIFLYNKSLLRNIFLIIFWYNLRGLFIFILIRLYYLRVRKLIF